MRSPIYVAVKWVTQICWDELSWVESHCGGTILSEWLIFGNALYWVNDWVLRSTEPGGDNSCARSGQSHSSSQLGARPVSPGLGTWWMGWEHCLSFFGARAKHRSTILRPINGFVLTTSTDIQPIKELVTNLSSVDSTNKANRYISAISARCQTLNQSKGLLWTIAQTNVTNKLNEHSCAGYHTISESRNALQTQTDVESITALF